MPADRTGPTLTDVFGQPALPPDVELPGDPLPLRRHLAQLRRERLRRDTGQDQDDGGDDP